MNGVLFGLHSFSDLDFADNVALLAELLELLVPVLEAMASEATSLRLELNWEKIKVQALDSREDDPSTITVLGQEVAVVEESVCFGSPVHSATQSSPDISRRNTIIRSVMQNLDNQIWKSRISASIKLKLYNTCILPIFLYGSEFWAVTKTDVLKIDTVDQWCLWS